jgi:hypothetical protein
MADDSSDPSVLTIYPNGPSASSAVSAPTTPPVQPAAKVSPQDRDIAIRTMIGEENTPAGQAGVASTMLNRLRSGQYGKSLTQIAHAPGQFEAWSRNGEGLSGISTSDPNYQLAASIFDGVAAGKVPDLTGGATHFYAPKAQAALGRKPPAWANGQNGTPLGKTLFFAPPANAGKPAPAVQAINAATSGEEPDLIQQYLRQDTSPTAEPDLIQQYLSAPAAAPSTPAQGPAEPDLIQQYLNAPAASASAPATQIIQPSPTGALGTGSSVANSSATGFVNGIPIIGPMLNSGLDRAQAAIMSLASDKPYSEALKTVQAREAGDVAAHPTANLLGGIGGGVAGTVPLVAAAPEAFGIGAGNLLARAGMGALSGAALGGSDSAIRSGGDLNSIIHGAKIGAATGAGAVGLGSALGWAGGKVLNMLSGTSAPAREVGNMLAGAGLSPQDARTALNRLGPSGTLADIDPALTTEAGALAARGGATTSLMKNSMRTRAAGADDRASQLMTSALGPKPDLTAATEAIENDAATRAGPAYAAGRNGVPLDVTPVLASIDSQLPNASGGVANVLNTVKGYLTNKVASAGNPTGLLVPKDDPASVLQARQALDDLIQKMPLDTSAGRNAMRTASGLRGQLDTVVKSNPSFAHGDAIYSQAMGVRDALQSGVDVFKRATRPEDMARTIQGMTPPELDAFRQGARVAIGDAMENTTRGEAAGAQSMFGRGTANRAKLDLLFPNASDVFDALHSEATMRGTERSILGQSVTAERQAAMKRWSPQAESSGISNDLLAAGEGLATAGPWGGVAAPLLRRGVNNLLSGVRQRASDRVAQGVASGLVSTGAPQQQFLNQLTGAAKSRAAHAAIRSGSQAIGYSTGQYVRNRLSGSAQ